MVKKQDGHRGINTYFQHNYITKYYIFSSENNFTLKCNIKRNVLKFTFKLHCANYMLAAICIQSLTLNTMIIQLILVGSR